MNHNAFDRRNFVKSIAGGIGALGLASLVSPKKIFSSSLEKL